MTYKEAVGVARIRFSRTPVFHFEALRAVWTAAAGGGDFGEVAAVMERVRPNDFESWYRCWSEMAGRVVDRARATGEPVSRGRALLRASNYVREAEFFLRPDDPRRVTAAAAQRRFFDAGTAYLGIPITRERIPYNPSSAPGAPREHGEHGARSRQDTDREHRTPSGHSPNAEGPHERGPHSNEPDGGAPHGAGTPTGGPHGAGPHNTGPHAGEPHGAGVHAGEPHGAGAHTGEPHGAGVHAGGAHGGEPDGGRPDGGGPSEARPEGGGAHLEALLLSPKARSERTVLVVQGGFDSTLEELYFMVGAGAAERGYHVLMFTGPGQGSTLREDGLPFTHEWERPTRAVLDWLDGQDDIDTDRTVGIGISFGGHLLARAAAFEDRYDGVVLFDYFPGMLDAFVHSVPAPLRGSFTRVPRWLRAAVPLYTRFDAQARWAIGNALWTFGADGLPDLIAKLRAYDDRGWADRITADTLVMVGEGEHFYDPGLARDFTGRLVNARSARLHSFPAAEGGHLHCQAGALEQAHEAIFEWLAATATTPEPA
ncbi:alpha/beta hydrolase family protein [Actinomadura rupiterrae]|uniref:alpha/beta hydrolase family protein n=1 Tax=Actinomadura rupiterrae TaxID=559627 RepID=UPI0020A5D8B8|nr:hypothetical protein [Actinomadura rupiterrae]MCP2338251.1 dienelactone hydrolase [Actinomadura rupiterrae]